MAGVTQTDDDPGAEGVEHLQAAARELLLAARSFLNVVEEVVEDRDRLAGAAAGVTDLLRDTLSTTLGSSAPLEPWERAAWQQPSPDPDPDPDAAADVDPGNPDPAATDPAGEGPAVRSDAEVEDPTAVKDPAPTRQPTRRVRRIAVD